MRIAVLIVLFSTKIFGQAVSDTLPSFAIKYNPIPLFLEVDRHLQMSFEYFIDSKRSAQFSCGFGNSSIFKKEDYEIIYMVRAEYRKYFRSFSLLKNGRGYKATELMYKHVQEPYNPIKPYGMSHLPTYTSHFFVNVLAAHFKVGREYVDLKTFPAFDIYFGLGVRAFYNYTGKVPSVYEDGLGADGKYGRGTGSGVSPSAVVGVGIGIGKWKRV